MTRQLLLKQLFVLLLPGSGMAMDLIEVTKSYLKSHERSIIPLSAPSCIDDPFGMMAVVGGCGNAAIAFGCNFPLSNLDPSSPPGVTISLLCPDTCNSCYCMDSPLLISLGGCEELTNMGCHFDLSALTGLPTGTPLSSLCPSSCNLCNPAPQSATSLEQSISLKSIFNAAGGQEWYRNSNWMNGDPCLNSWDGISCDLSGNIISIQLDYNNMKGFLADVFLPLIHLRKLDTSGNEFLSGKLPESLSACPFERIIISECSFVGDFPILTAAKLTLKTLAIGSLALPMLLPPHSGVARMGYAPSSVNSFPYQTFEEFLNTYPELEVINSHGSQIRGTLPESMCSSKLRDIVLTKCFLSGTIPNCVGDMPQLQSFCVAENGLTGTVPASLGNASNLLGVILGGNSLTGQLPMELGNARNLRYLIIAISDLTGTIPDSLGNLTSLEAIVLQDCPRLGGTLPVGIFKLTKLGFVALMESSIEGEIPTAVTTMPSLSLLSLYSNQLSGTIPAFNFQRSQITEVYLSTNLLTGTVPDSLYMLPKLRKLSIDKNSLTGELPKTVQPDFVILNAHNNLFEGTIPSEWCSYKKMEHIYIQNNSLTGQIPSCIGNMSELTQFNIDDNKLSGKIPWSLGEAKKLVFIWMRNNKLTGAPPQSLSGLVNLKEYHSSGNPFNCPVNDFLSPFTTVPELLSISCHDCGLLGDMSVHLFYSVSTGSRFTLLSSLVLSENKITGRIPTSIGWGLLRLALLDLSTNNLQGPIPEGLGNLRMALMDNNKDLKSVDGRLPLFVATTTASALSGESDSVRCPILNGVKQNIVVRIDPSYYSYNLCDCGKGFFGSAPFCVSCLQNGICPGGGSMIVTKGYWPSPPPPAKPIMLLPCYADAVESTPCNEDNAINFTCKTGYQGRLCSSCAENYYNRGRQCVECPINVVIIIIMFSTVLILAGALAAMRMWKKHSQLFDMFRVLVLYGQVQAILLGDSQFLWPRTVKRVLGGPFSTFMLSPAIFSCAANLSWFNFEGGNLSIILMSCFWVVVAAIFCLAVHSALKRHIATVEEEEDFLVIDPATEGYPKYAVLTSKTALTVLSLLYLPVTVISMKVFQCETDPVDRQDYMIYSPSVECTTGQGRYKTMFITSICLIPTVVVGLPLLYLYIVYRIREVRVRESAGARKLCGFLFLPYNPNCYWYFAVAMMRRVSVGFAISIVPADSGMSVPLLFLLIITFIVVHKSYMPMSTPILNTLETASLSSLLVTCCCGTMFSTTSLANSDLLTGILLVSVYPILAVSVFLVYELLSEGSLSYSLIGVFPFLSMDRFFQDTHSWAVQDDRHVKCEIRRRSSCLLGLPYKTDNQHSKSRCDLDIVEMQSYGSSSPKSRQTGSSRSLSPRRGSHKEIIRRLSSQLPLDPPPDPPPLCPVNNVTGQDLFGTTADE